MIYILVAVLAVISIYFSLRYLLLRKAVKESNDELREITCNMEENRIVKLLEPNKELEDLLQTINHALYAVRQSMINCDKKEAALKKQIENVSHDLRTPLTSLLGYLYIIDENSLDCEAVENLDVIKRKARSLQKLITNFYELSRLNAGDYTLNIEPLDIGRKLKETVMEFYQRLSDRGLEINIEIPDKTGKYITNANALERVFGNLLENILRYAKTCFQLTLEENNDVACIVFENDCEGLEETDLERLFDRFYTVDYARSHDSTGLGLTIAKQLVEKMGGTINGSLVNKNDIQYLQMVIKFER